MEYIPFGSFFIARLLNIILNSFFIARFLNIKAHTHFEQLVQSRPKNRSFWLTINSSYYTPLYETEQNKREIIQ